MKFKQKQFQLSASHGGGVRIDYDLYQALQEIAKMENTTVKEVASRLLEIGLEAYKREQEIPNSQ